MSGLESNNQQTSSTTNVTLIDQIMKKTRLKPEDDGYETAKTGVKAFIADLLEPTREGEKVEQRVVDQMIAEIDNKISVQMDQIIHHAQFQELESAWRGAKMVIDRTDFKENIRIEMISISKSELLEDFEDAPEVTKSGLYQHAYVAEYGQFGGKPYAAIIGNFAFNPSAQDVRLMQQLASVGAMSHAPLLPLLGLNFLV